MGLPVVSTDLMETRVYNKNFNNIVKIGKNFEIFNEKIKQCLKRNTKSEVNNRISAAKKNSWESRFKFFNELIENSIIHKNSNSISWKNKFLKEYNRFVYTNLKKVSLVLILFIIMFKSPLVPYLGNYLIIQDQIKEAKMMVVFSGDGENNYHNLSFQKRIIDIKKIKEKYPDIKITLTGRVAIFREAEIIKSLLVSEGVNKEDIIVIKEDPYNTYENIQVVNNFLQKKA